MKKFAVLSGLLLVASLASAAVTVDTAPTSLVTSATTLAADSELAVFKFALTGDDAETLSSVKVTVNSSTAVSDDLDRIAVLKDDGDGSFDNDDTEVGSNTNVNIDSLTTINTSSGDLDLTSEELFFVVIETDSSWLADDSITITLGTSGIVTSDNSPTVSAVTTSAINASDEDEDGPDLQSAVAMNKTGSTSGLEAGDKVVLTFDEATEKPTIDKDNIDDVLVLNNSDSWLDDDGEIGSATWNSAGTVLTVVLSDGNGVPDIALGDTVTVTGSVIQDEDDNDATGTKTITGSFSASNDDNDDECDEEEGDNDDCDEEDPTAVCAGGIINGRLYKLSGSENTTVYLAAGCRLKPFRGAAVFHARGHKFQNITELSSLSGITVSDHPALPASGTLVKGSDATVWVVTKGGKKRGFVSATAFTRLGFKFNTVNEISDSDLTTLETDEPVTENSTHPDGAVVKCGNSPEVFEVRGSSKFPFANADAFLNRGHSWEHITVVDCGRFYYTTGSIVSQ
ncbi:MAG: hypothetical protein KW793_02420 [Candidatus Doudnabacteria bacterium]|nr:hypothetical protein [Candidatus Doudnabacteria bacterium]